MARRCFESLNLPPKYNAGLLIQPADTGSPPLRETMEAQQHTRAKKHRGPHPHKGIDEKATEWQPGGGGCNLLAFSFFIIPANKHQGLLNVDWYTKKVTIVQNFDVS